MSTTPEMRYAALGDLPLLLHLAKMADPHDSLCKVSIELCFEYGDVRVMEVADKIIGFWAGAVQASDQEIYVLGEMTLHPHHRDNGLSYIMIADLAWHATEYECRFVDCFVPEYKAMPGDEQSILKWLKKHGFHATGVIERNAFTRDGNNYDGYFFRKIIKEDKDVQSERRTTAQTDPGPDDGPGEYADSPEQQSLPEQGSEDDGSEDDGNNLGVRYRPDGGWHL